MLRLDPAQFEALFARLDWRRVTSLDVPSLAAAEKLGLCFGRAVPAAIGSITAIDAPGQLPDKIDAPKAMSLPPKSAMRAKKCKFNVLRNCWATSNAPCGK